MNVVTKLCFDTNFNKVSVSRHNKKNISDDNENTMLPFRFVCRHDSWRCGCATEHKYNKFNTRCAKSVCIKIEGLKRSKPSTSTFFLS